MVEKSLRTTATYLQERRSYKLRSPAIVIEHCQEKSIYDCVPFVSICTTDTNIFNIRAILGSSNKPSTYTHNNAKKKYGPTRAIISPTLGFHFSPYSMTKREKRGDGERVGVEDDKGPMVGQHLEGARIKLLRADLVGGSVCAGAAS